MDYAHKRIAKVFGENWKDEYVVWDCCCGTKNLTRDYNFKELYCSTLFQSELDMSVKYNTNSVSFQFDFLNDDIEKIPVGLMNALKENKKIIFLMNPPYGSASNMNTDANDHKAGICKTKINDMMRGKFGKASANLYAQFLYRIMMLKEKYNANISLAFFCNPTYLVGDGYRSFVSIFCLISNMRMVSYSMQVISLIVPLIGESTLRVGQMVRLLTSPISFTI